MAFTPLEGVRVLDLSRLIPGAAATHFLADYGADVVKVEQPPRGDYLREVLPQVDGHSLHQLTLDRNKRSLLLDLRDPDGRAVLHHLVTRADVVVEVSRPGAMARLGADYGTLSAINPRLVYLSLTGFGQDSPYADLPTHGSNLASFAGVNGYRVREDGVIVHDSLPYGRYRIPMEQAALFGAFAVVCALRERERTGRGRHLDLAIVHALMAGDYAAMTDRVNTRETFWADLPQPTPRYAYYRTKDGLVLLVCPLERRFWLAFCKVIGREDLASRGDWDDRAMDFGIADVDLYHEVQRTIETRSREEWLALLIPARVPCSPVNSIDDACEDPTLGGGLLSDSVTLPTGRTVTLMGPPVQDPAGSFRSRPAPSAGQDSAAVLEDYEVEPEVVAAARASGALADLPEPG